MDAVLKRGSRGGRLNYPRRFKLKVRPGSVQGHRADEAGQFGRSRIGKNLLRWA